jgi:tetratricopeptide (TPR) repeat protein
MTEHLTDLEIADYLDNPERRSRRQEMEGHLSVCETCRNRIDAAQRFDAEVYGALVADFIAAAKQRVSTPHSLLTQAQQIDAEEREANEFLRGIVGNRRAFERAALRDAPALHSVGIVHVLCDASLKLREREPQHALRLADEAISIARVLSAERYDETSRTEALAESLLERGNVLRYLTRYAESLETLDECETAYRATPLSERPLAMINHVRSIIYMETERIDEASALAAETARIFDRYGDTDRVVHARMVIGGCLYYGRQYHLACDLYRSLLRQARKIDEPLTVALCLMNLAHTETELGEFAGALQHYAEAADLYERIGVRTELLRARWGVADADILMGNMLGGLVRLRKTAAEMLRLGMANDHAKVMLDLAGNLFAIGRVAELPAICADLVRVFNEASMPENARIALAYLDAAVREGAVNRPLIESVADYLDSEQYDAPFIPPLQA